MLNLDQEKLIDNKEEKQFQFNIEGKIAKVEYILAGNKIILTHTEVPKTLEGRNVGSILVKKVLTNVQERKLKLVPLCPFVAAYIRRHTEWKKIVDESINI